MELDIKYSEIQKMKVKEAKKAIKNSLINIVDYRKELIDVRGGDKDEAAQVILRNHPDWKYCNQILYGHDQKNVIWLKE